MTLGDLTQDLSNNGTLPVVSVIGLTVGICLFFWGFQLLRRRRLILDTPRSKIRSASLGTVEVSGLAVGPHTIVAPITARPCYYYSTAVWEWKKSGDDKEWIKVAGEYAHVPFFLDDTTGRLLVDPRGADLDIPCEFQQEFCDSFFSTKDRAPDNVCHLLARHGVSTRNRIKVEEYCIKPKETLFILGTLAENPGLEVTASPGPDVKSANFDGFDPQPHVVLMKGTYNKTFLVSSHSRQDVVRSLRWQCTLMIWGGPVLSLLCLYVLLSVTHLF